jgi:NADPH2:quinone reductase
VNYRTEDVAERVLAATRGAGVDRVIEVDAAANIDLDLALLAQDGEIVIYGSGKPSIPMPFGPLIRKNVRAIFFIVYNLRASIRNEAIPHLTSMLASNALVHNLAARLPHAQLAEAHEMVEQGGALGNVVVRIGADGTES